MTIFADRSAAEAFFFESARHLQNGDMAQAEACLREAVRIAPAFAEAHTNLGFICEQQGRWAEAEASYRQALALNPTCAQTHQNIGVLLAKQKRFQEAEAAYRQALLINPHHHAAWSNLGALYASLRRDSEAENCHRTAIRLNEEYRAAYFNLSYLLLRQGRFDEGWQCLEKRNWYATQERYFTCPRWRGEALAGKSILISFEAGHGDMIQFCRYAAVLKARGAARITLLCHPDLKILFLTLEAVDNVMAFDEQVPASGWDYWTPPFSIPFYCGTRLETIPASLPYLHALPERLAKWRAKLPVAGLRVGLAWKGNPLFENDADRSLPDLKILAPLWTVAGVHFISLQKGAGEDEATHPPAGQPLLDLGLAIEDFADTAAIIQMLDLVICVDTAVAHLAGALGKSCWILLPEYKTDWRWLTGREDSPWYPGCVRLFRQKEMGNWRTVVFDLQIALSQWQDAFRSNPADR